jgi:hypothetical protein
MAVHSPFVSTDADTRPMSQNVTLIDSNNAAFPCGSRAWGLEKHGVLWSLAGYDVEDTTYCADAHQVTVRTAMGYLFTISTTDYHLIVAE